MSVHPLPSRSLAHDRNVKARVDAWEHFRRVYGNVELCYGTLNADALADKGMMRDLRDALDDLFYNGGMR